jgi:hypothetical protein
MFDLSKEFNDFYTNHTILPRDTKDDLREKKKLNIERLESGLEEYNDEEGTDYAVFDTKEQGSVAMSTVTQNDSNDYDIDVAIIFEEDNIGENTGSTKAKNIVRDALKKKCTNFKTEPTSLTNCVRIEYADGYHVDFAIYKKVDDTYYHAGSSWQERNPMAINDWFNKAVKDKGEKLRSIVRLSKMFCKSRDSWLMPGGLIQSVLCEECFIDYERLDECFYYTMKKIVDRLESSIEVYNPTDSSKSLLLKKKDMDKMNNWKSRLNDKLSNLDIITKSTCTKKQAFDSWHDFFNHSFWEYIEEETAEVNNRYANVIKNSTAIGEEFIEKKYTVYNYYDAAIECSVTANGFMPQLLSNILKAHKWLPRNRELLFSCKTNTPAPYDVLWKIRNVGAEAERRNMLRGKIEKSNHPNHRRKEHTNFWGPHFVECYVIKNGICVARARIDVPIE